MGYLSNRPGDDIPFDQEVALEQLADLGDPYDILRVNEHGTGIEYVPPQSIEDVNWGEIGGDITDQTDLTLQSVTDNGSTTTNNITAASFIKTGGLSSQFLKADGSSDSTDYLTTATASSTYVPYTGATGDVDLGANNLTVDTNVLFVDAINNRVGIGTTAPTSSLHISKSYDGGVDDLIPQMKIINPSTTAGQSQFAFIKCMTGNGFAGGYPEIWVQAFSSTSGASSTAIRTVSNSPMQFYTNNAVRATISATGNVGIGTTTPTEKLQVSGNVFLTADNDKLYQGTGKDFSQYYDGTNQNFDLTGGSFKFNGGNIGINVSNPTYILDINGTSSNPEAIVRLTANSVNNDAALILNERSDLGCEIRYTGGTGNNLQFNMNSGSGMTNYMEINRDTGNLNVVYSALIGGQAQEVNNLSQLKVSASDDNGGIVINRMTTNTGAYAGIKFSSTVVTRNYLKSGIFFARTGSNGVGDLSFAFNNISDSSNVDIDDTKIKMTKEGHLKLIQDNSKLYFGADDDEYLEYDPTLDGIQTAGKFKASEVRAIHKASDGTAPVADGTYTVGIGGTTNGTITIKDGIITAVQEAS
jgi:hypothetical protein